MLPCFSNFHLLKVCCFSFIVNINEQITVVKNAEAFTGKEEVVQKAEQGALQHKH